jgi:hypothetical protein
MPLVRCPDCLRDIEVSQADLSLIIECAACDARFGPIVPPARVSNRTDESPEDSEVGEPSKRIPRQKVFKPKPRTRVLPILLGTVCGLAATGAILGAMYLVLTATRPASAVDKPPPAPERTARPGSRP